MDIQEFVCNSIGNWRSQRSAHHLAFGHFEAVQSEIDITSLSIDAPEVIELAKLMMSIRKPLYHLFGWLGKGNLIGKIAKRSKVIAF
jgi:hypothetical protein